MAHTFYIRPWEHERLTIWEYYAFCNVIDRHREDAAHG